MTLHRDNLPRVLLRHSVWFITLVQALVIFCSLLLAWLLRFDFVFRDFLVLLSAAPILITIRLVAIGRFGLLHGWWRYTGVSDILDIIKAVALGSVAFFLLWHTALRIMSFPRSIYILEPLITLGLLSGARLLSRAIAESVHHELRSSKRVVVIGAGFSAGMILREIVHRNSGYHAIACLDDDVSKVGLKIQGVPVLGTVDQLPVVVRKYPADEILIAVPSATGLQMQRFVSLCERTGVKFRTVPAVRELIAGHVSVNELRDVNLDDLLGRNPVVMDLESVRSLIRDRTVLVTGAAGSIGSELCRQILEYNPAKLLSIDQSETGIFYLDLELSKHKNGARLVCCVADIADRDRLHSILAEHRPEVIFHAAAYKHVPIMESNVHEAVKNNILALAQLLELAEMNGCQSFVLISSDKAVNPTNVMGVTKRIGELIIACRPRNSMRCASVRFGNVLGSNGSVVQVFQEQLRNGQQLTLTHPEIKRFFMTTQEAVSLVLEAFVIGEHGDILVLDMGEPVLIVDLAKSLIHLSGKTEDQVALRFTGLRPGEKLYEELFYPTERALSTDSGKIHRARGQLPEWSYLVCKLEELKRTLTLDGAEPIRIKLKQIVPEYSYTEGLGGAAVEEPLPVGLERSSVSF